ncbi:hypothetical protein ACFOD4_02580 [Pseudoroseomonas globiformis]|uniref:Uncharacterized protein n=1 Tax=Teichococcus globiformis TaxID=2307229 RepID=A0ABV7FU95_9PROT
MPPPAIGAAPDPPDPAARSTGRDIVARTGFTPLKRLPLARSCPSAQASARRCRAGVRGLRVARPTSGLPHSGARPAETKGQDQSRMACHPPLRLRDLAVSGLTNHCRRWLRDRAGGLEHPGS